MLLANHYNFIRNKLNIEKENANGKYQITDDFTGLAI